MTLPGRDPRCDIRSGAKNSVSDEATASTSAALAHQLDVAVAGEAHARQARERQLAHLLAVEPHALGQAQPEREAALALLLAVVVADRGGSTRGGTPGSSDFDRMIASLIGMRVW